MESIKESDELIYGLHAVRHALEYSPEVVRELWLQRRKESDEIMRIKRLAERAGVAIRYVSKESLDKHSGSGVHQGVLIWRRPSGAASITSIDVLLASMGESVPLILVLDGIQDPHNLGACLRTANAAGVTAVIIPKDRATPVNATVRKVASGAAEHTPVITVTNLARGLRQLKEAGIWVLGAADDGASNLFETDLTAPLALVLGGEGQGLRENTRKQCDDILHIPMVGQVESLNISVAAGIALYETLRQRR